MEKLAHLASSSIPEHSMVSLHCTEVRILGMPEKPAGETGTFLRPSQQA